mmetsp:Transcript_3145/g.12618  ORF Transcript_3145/g.12618 Transcript_3145/m.12618 type:complete len:306 (-) Transcript_3145:391-1308(-)
MQRSAEEPAESAAAGAPDPDPVEDLQGPEASSRAPDTGIDAQDAPDAPDSGGSESPPKKKLRRGKWTPEEEAYVERIIHDFNAGLLDVPAGTTLRTYLSQKLNCDPMRITKKFTGASCIGKRVFHPRGDRSGAGASELDRAKEELATLEARWRKRLSELENDTTGKSVVKGRRASRNTGQQSAESESVVVPNARKVDNWQTLILNWLHRAERALQDDAVQLADLDSLTDEGNRLKDDRFDQPSSSTSEDHDVSGVRQGSIYERLPAGDDVYAGGGRLSSRADSVEIGKASEVDAGAALFNLRKKA